MEIPWSDGQGFAAFCGLFERLWTDVIEMTVTTSSTLTGFNTTQHSSNRINTAPAWFTCLSTASKFKRTANTPAPPPPQSHSWPGGGNRRSGP